MCGERAGEEESDRGQKDRQKERDKQREEMIEKMTGGSAEQRDILFMCEQVKAAAVRQCVFHIATEESGGGEKEHQRTKAKVYGDVSIGQRNQSVKKINLPVIDTLIDLY